MLDELGRELADLEGSLEAGGELTWSSVVEPLERMGDHLERSWSGVRHLMGVRNSDALREAHGAVQGDVVAFGLRLGQSPPIFAALSALAEGDGWQRFAAGQRRVLLSLLREAKHAGVGLEGEPRERFNAIQAELAALATRFTNQVMDATKAFALTLRSPDEVDGLPESARQLAAARSCSTR